MIFGVCEGLVSDDCSILSYLIFFGGGWGAVSWFRLDGIVTEVDYVVQQINESKTQLAAAEESGRKMKRMTSALSQKEIQNLLQMYLKSVVEMHAKERKDAHRITELEVVLAEKGSQIDHRTR